MKHLQVRALVIMMTCWCGIIAQDKVVEPVAPLKTVSNSPSGVEANEKLASKVNFETKHKAVMDRRKAADADRKKVDAHLRKLRRGWALESEKKRVVLERLEAKGRTPRYETKVTKDSTGAKK